MGNPKATLSIAHVVASTCRALAAPAVCDELQRAAPTRERERRAQCIRCYDSEMPIAYAPSMPRPAIAWLLEHDPDTGRTVAFLPDRDGQVLNVSRRNAGRAEFESFAAACAAYRLDAMRDVELRWWEGLPLLRVVESEMRRLGVDGVVLAADPGVIVRTETGDVRITGAFDVYEWGRRVLAG